MDADRNRRYRPQRWKKRSRQTWKALRESVPWWFFTHDAILPTIWLIIVYSVGVGAALLGNQAILIGYMLLIVGGAGYSIGMQIGRNQ